MPSTLPRPIRLFLLLTTALTALCLLTEAICRTLHLPLRYTWPLFPSLQPFEDLTIYRARMDFYHSPAFFTAPGWPYMYPAPLSLVYKLFYFAAEPGLYLVLPVIAAFLAALAALGRALYTRGLSKPAVALVLAGLCLATYPLAFELQQANLEAVVWCAIAAGIFFQYRDRPYAAAACFGLAGAMKIFPLVFLGLLLSRRQYRQTAFALLVAAVTTLATLWALCPNLPIAWRGISTGLKAFRSLYALHYQYDSLGYDHSLFGLLKLLLATVHGAPALSDAPSLLLTAYVALTALAGLACYVLRIRKLPFTNQVLALTVASILLPPVSFDYTLVHLYAPLVLLLLVAVSRRDLPGLTPCLLLFAVLLTPQSELILATHVLAGQLKAIALLALFVLALRFPYSLQPPSSSPQPQAPSPSRA